MKQFIVCIALLCGSYNLQAQAYLFTIDSTVQKTQMTPRVALDLPFIGIVDLESLPYAFQQAVIPFQIPELNRDGNNFNLPEIDSLVSVQNLKLQAQPKANLVELDSLDEKG